MAKNTIDKIFEENLKNHKIEPSRNLWDDIENRLENKGQKKTKVIWLSVAASIVILLVSIGLWFNQNKESVENNSIAEGNKEIKNTEKKQQDEEDNSVVNESLLEDVEEESQNVEITPIDTNRNKSTKKKQQVKSQKRKNNLKPKTSPKKKIEKQKEALKLNTFNDPIAENVVKENQEEEPVVTVSVSLHSKPKSNEYVPEQRKPSKIGKAWRKVKKAKNGGETASED